MLEDDPLSPSAKKPLSLEAELENASVGDLEARIERLREEIVLCEQKIASKRAQRNAAESVFSARPS